MFQVIQCFIDQLTKSLDQSMGSKMTTEELSIQSIDTICDYFVPLEKNFGHKPQFKLEMMQIFIQQMPIAMGKMRAALLENNLEALHFEAHRIRSTIKIIGLPRLEIIIRGIEHNTYLKKDLAQLPELFQSFQCQTLKDLYLIQIECKNIKTAVKGLRAVHK